MDQFALGALVTVYAVLNILAFALFVVDKYKAKKDKWRIKESTLLLAALLGPWGAVIGMRAAHHKTRKPKFKLVYVFLVLHIVLIVYLFYRRAQNGPPGAFPSPLCQIPYILRTSVSAPGCPRRTTRLSSRSLITDMPTLDPSWFEKSLTSAKEGMQSMVSLVREPPTKT